LEQPAASLAARKVSAWACRALTAEVSRTTIEVEPAAADGAAMATAAKAAMMVVMENCILMVGWLVGWNEGRSLSERRRCWLEEKLGCCCAVDCCCDDSTFEGESSGTYTLSCLHSNSVIIVDFSHPYQRLDVSDTELVMLSRCLHQA
jgi:hypothetical protein